MREFPVLLVAAILIGGLLVLATTIPAGGQATKPVAVQPDEDEAQKDNEAGLSIRNLIMAHNLVEYARKHNSPEALIVAAQLIGKVPAPREMNVADTAGNKGKPGDGPPNAGNPPKEDEPSDLIAEAKKMRSADAHLAAIADRIAEDLKEKPRGAVGGPYQRKTWVHPNRIGGTSSTHTFKHGSNARVYASNNQNCTLRLTLVEIQNGRHVDVAGPVYGIRPELSLPIKGRDRNLVVVIDNMNMFAWAYVTYNTN